MADSWYYAGDGKRNGPFSGQQLRDLADAGTIVATDTIWKMGVAQGVLAARVKHLFPIPDTMPAVIAEGPLPVGLSATPPAPVSEPFPSNPSLTPLTEGRQTEPASDAPQARPEPPPRRRTASASKGTIIMGQDGVQVKYKKQCTTCKHTDNASTTMKITAGLMKAMFYCPKCRKQREVELRGS